MKCPRCSNAFPLTWERYFKAPFGRFPCPSCGARLVGRHTWFYWPLVVLGCCALALPLGYLAGKHFGLFGCITGLVLGGLLSGIPIDRFLESRFLIIKVQKPGPATLRSPSTSEGR